VRPDGISGRHPIGRHQALEVALNRDVVVGEVGRWSEIPEQDGRRRRQRKDGNERAPAKTSKRPAPKAKAKVKTKPTKKSKPRKSSRK